MTTFLKFMLTALAAYGGFLASQLDVGPANAAVQRLPILSQIIMTMCIAGLAWFAMSRITLATVTMPRARQSITWAALSGWTVACVTAALLISFWHALHLAFGFGRENRILTPEEWIYARAIVAGLTLSVLAAMWLLKPQIVTD